MRSVFKREWNDPSRENPHIVIQALARLVNPIGRIGIAGVFLLKGRAA